MTTSGTSLSDSAGFRHDWKGRQIDVFDTRIYLEEHGEGPPLVCLHSFASNGRARFGPLLPVLSRHFHCYIVDLRGHGRSEIGTAHWTHEQVARDIIELCRKLGLTSAYFLATSSGAMAMLRVARYAPGLVRAMVLDSTTNEVPVTSRQFYRDPEHLTPKLKELYRTANEIHGPEFGPTLAKIFYDFRLPECDINQPIELMREIEQPTLLVHPDRDIFFPLRIAEALNAAIPNSELYVSEDTGHIVMEFYPEVVARLATEFFSRVTPNAD
jgi:pimeloyl-ACP methyl ester carboxylesterase